MSRQTKDAAPAASVGDERAAGPVELLIAGRRRDVGGLMVRRVLPTSRRRMVGPFIFFDHFGPVALPPGRGLDVAPHPHIGLATLTYLFEGELIHRDSLGSVQAIRPGAVNWMTAGRGIVHSERSSPEDREIGPRLNGIQAWVALPASETECAPSFHHHPVSSLPMVEGEGFAARLLAGAAYGARSPVAAHSSLFYLDAIVQPGGGVPIAHDNAQRAVYVVAGSLVVGGEAIGEGALAVLRPACEARIVAQTQTRVMVLGGAPFEEPRHIWWNFVAPSRARIEKAKEDWKQGRFAPVPGEHDAIALPDA